MYLYWNKSTVLSVEYIPVLLNTNQELYTVKQ